MDDVHGLEDLAREANARSTEILESITDGFLAIDAQWRFTYVNGEAGRLVGRNHAELVGKNLWDEFPGLAGTEFERTYRRCAAERIVCSTVTWYPGHQRFYDVRAFPAAAGITVYFRDVTETKNAEAEREGLLAELRTREERYRALFSSVDQGFCIIEMLYDEAGQPHDYRFLEANEVFERQTGFVATTGKTVRELVPDIEPHWPAIYGRVARTGEPSRFVDESPALNRWFDVYAVRVGGDGSNKVALLFSDITARKRADDDLRASERRERERAEELEAIMRAVPAAIWITHDVECRHVTGNPEAYRLVRSAEGLNISATAPESDAPFRRFRELLDGVPAAPDELPLQVAARTGKPVQGAELSLVFEDGVVHHALGNAAALLGPDGKSRGAVAAFVDITPLRTANEELARRQRELQEADQRKDEFLAVLAHELRNPLAPIRSGLQVLAMSPGADAKSARVREMMDRQLGHMVRLIDDLLDVSRITRGKVELRRDVVDARTLVDTAVEASRPVIEGSRHTLTVKAPDQPLPVMADPTRIAQVLTNLLNNAAKYTPDGGRIDVTTTREGGHVVFRVTDNGIGIPREMMPDVFEMFTQVDRTLSRAQRGLGIGLALAKKLVQMHDGTIEGESGGPGTGSTFTVRLPLSPGHELDEAESPTSDARGTGRRVLVVDDNIDGAEMLAMYLDLIGNETKTVYDGRSAIEVASAWRPEVVFLDIGLPDTTGYEVAKTLRARPELSSSVLIALTGWGSAADKRQADDAGFDAHLTKPVDVAAVKEILKRFSGGRRAGQPIR